MPGAGSALRLRMTGSRGLAGSLHCHWDCAPATHTHVHPDGGSPRRKQDPWLSASLPPLPATCHGCAVCGLPGPVSARGEERQIVLWPPGLTTGVTVLPPLNFVFFYLATVLLLLYSVVKCENVPSVRKLQERIHFRCLHSMQLTLSVPRGQGRTPCGSC